MPDLIDIEDLLKYHEDKASGSSYSPCFIGPTNRKDTAIALRLLLAEVRACRQVAIGPDQEGLYHRSVDIRESRALAEARAATDAQIRGVRP